MSEYRDKVGDEVMDSTTSRRETMKRFSLQPPPMAAQPGKQSGTFPESEALGGVLRRLGLPIEAIFQAEEAQGGIKSLISERQQLLDELHHHGTAGDALLTAELLPTDWANRLLSSSLEANSLFTASLSSLEHETALSQLESKLGQIQKGMEKLNQDVVYQRDKTQGKFLERWG